MTEQEKKKMEVTDVAGLPPSLTQTLYKSERNVFADACDSDTIQKISEIVWPCDRVPSTNQRAELTAILEAMIVAEKRD